MNNDITIASRANLYSKLKKYYDVFIKDIRTLNDFHYELDAPLKSKYYQYIGKQYLFSLFTSLETLLVDSSIDILISYPAKIGKINNDTELLTDVSTLTEAIRYHAAKKINEMTYKKPLDFITEVYGIFGEKLIIDENVFGNIIEGKATRDLYMHGNGKTNFIYFEKAGKYARAKNEGDLLKIDDKYLAEISKSVLALGANFLNSCIEKHQNDNPINTFRKMWEMSSLNELVAFDKQWKVVNSSICMHDFNWPWSGSEQVLFNFFKYVFGGEREGLKISDIPYALYRWKGQRDERIIQSWLESQFFL